MPAEAHSSVALVVTLYFEHLALSPTSYLHKDEQHVRGRSLPRYRQHGWLEYGNRVGIFRILDLLDRHALRATVAANSQACSAYPQLVEMFATRGYEFAAHGQDASYTPPADEAAFMRDCAASVTAASGAPVTGWISQDFLQSGNAVISARAAGLRYVADFANDDMPFMLDGVEDVVCVPAQYELDDVRVLYDRRVNAWDYADMLVEGYGVLAAEARTAPKVMSLSIHPWVLGMPHRFRHLSGAIERIVATGGYWNPTAGELAEWYRRELAKTRPAFRFT